jgi:GNAT superfamily N-acetyltransferase
LAFTPDRLRAEDDVSEFSCGNQSLDKWLERCRDADRAGTSRVYTWRDGGRIVAYFATAPHLVHREHVPGTLARGAPDTIPGILIAKLALSQDLQGRGLGGALLVDALEVCLSAMRIAGGRLIIVEAIDDRAQGFYEHYGFSGLAEDPRRLLYIKASSAAKSIGMDWP